MPIVVKKNMEKCSSCGGNLIFSPDDKCLKCVKCSNLENVDYVPFAQKHDYVSGAEDKQKYQEFINKNKVFKCSNCGAMVVLNNLEVSKTCPYCNTSFVAQSSELEGLKPDAVIPFKFSSSKARDIYKANVKKRWMIPNVFKKNPPLESIKGIYIPSFSFDAFTSTTYAGLLEKDYTTTVHGKEVVRTERKHISGNKEINFLNILVETSSHIDQLIFDGIKPYNALELVKFDTSFIMGYSLEYYDQNLNKCKEIANNIMENKIKSSILAQYSYDRVVHYKQDVTYSNEKYSYNIVPIYQIKYKYKGKDYTTYMNGQTGKVGYIPKSKTKITFLSLTVVLIIVAIILCFIFL